MQLREHWHRHKIHPKNGYHLYPALLPPQRATIKQSHDGAGLRRESSSNFGNLAVAHEQQQTSQLDRMHKTGSKEIPLQTACHLHAELPCRDDNQRLHRGPRKVYGREDRQEIGQCFPGTCLR